MQRKKTGIGFCGIQLNWAATFCLLITLFFPVMALALSTSDEQVRRVVNYWLFQNQTPLSARMGTEIRDVVTFNDDLGEPLYHVVELEPEGFVIVSGDDGVEPIIAFVPRGEFDPSHETPLGAMVSQDVPQRVAVARGREVSGKGLAPAQQKWADLDKIIPDGAVAPKLAEVSDERVTPFIESNWGQRTEGHGELCYNLFTTPTHYPSGCVATAMSQVMYHYRYPNTEIGTESFQISVDNDPEQRNLLGGDGSGGAYNWALMEDGPEILEQTHRDAIGYLLHDTGVSVYTAYSSRVSIANTLRVADRLLDLFDYANAKKGISASYVELPADARNTMTNPNLDAGLPVIFSVKYHDVEADVWFGHAVVSDGYGYDNQTLYHHLNMGWSGNDDAWYNLPDIDADNFALNLVQSCVYNIYIPDNDDNTSETGEIISGRVTNSDGVPLPGVIVTAVRVGSNPYHATTNDKGIYALIKLPFASEYTITAASAGFSFNSYDDIDLAKVSTGTSTDGTTTVGNVWGVDFSGVSLDPVRPTVSTQAVTAIQNTTATGNGTVILAGNLDWVQHGMVWGRSPHPDAATADGISYEGSVRPAGAFTSSMTRLLPGTTYYVRAFVLHELGHAYGDDVVFTTSNDSSPTVITSPVTNIALSSATGGGNISETGNSNVSQHGICWDLSENPTTTDSCTRQGAAGTGVFTSSMTGLLAATAYHVRAYAVNNMGTAYGADISFSTDSYTLPVVGSYSVTDISNTSATVNGTIFTLGNPGAMTQHGFCWDSSSAPDISGNCSQLGSSIKTGNFSDSINGLVPLMKYYVRPYAISEAGISYGPERSFTTTDTSENIVTGAVSSISATAATGSVYIKLENGLTLDQHGVCWSKSNLPTIADFCSEEGVGSKTISTTTPITKISAGNTYYVRAYATKGELTGYGNEVSFTAASYASVTTAQIYPASDRAFAIGSIVSLGSPNPSRYGFCWSDTANPTTADQCLNQGAVSSTGPFAAMINGLSPATSYHVRAYVTNNAGTRYGLDVSFTTDRAATSPWALFLPAIQSGGR